MGRAIPWTPAEDEWIRMEYPCYGNAELERMKAEDGWPRSKRAIEMRARELGVRKDPERGYRKPQPRSFWTDERIAWFREFVPGHEEREISDEHERLFGTPLTEGQIGCAKTKFGVKSGTHGGQYRKGNVPANKGRTWDEWMPEASREGCRRTQFRKGQVSGIAKERDRGLLGIRIADGYREIRVDPRNATHTMSRWIPLAKFNWMAANGRDWPDGCKAVHIDGDQLNDEPENVMPVPESLWTIVNGAVPGGLEWHDRESLKAAITYAKLVSKRRALERRLRSVEGHPWEQDRKFGEGVVGHDGENPYQKA